MEKPLLKLSPTSATDFKSCPQLFKFRSIDRLEEPTSAAAARGSLVHAVLERLFTEAPENRSPEHADELLVALWKEVRENPEFRPEGMGVTSEEDWLGDNRTLLRNYFPLADPRGPEASRLEWRVEYELTDIHLRGRID